MKDKGVAAAGHELTARTIEHVLGDGGNAFDAVLAGMCTACVCEPVLASLGGGGFLLAHAGNQSVVYDFFVQTPRRKRPERELDLREVSADFGPAKQTFHIGLGSIATPGLLKGLFAIHRDLGSMPMRDVVAPAIGHARAGVRMTAFQAYVLRVVAPIFGATAGAREIYGGADGDRPLGEGELLVQTDLADVLEILALEGEDLFYRGEVGRRISDACRQGGGCLTQDDLEAYEVLQRAPLVASYRKVQLLTNPPPSSGGILIAFALGMLECVDHLGQMGFGSSNYLRLLATVMGLTDKARLEEMLRGDGPRTSFDRLLDPALIESYRAEVLNRAQSLNGTTQLGAMDAAGNVATMTLSNGSASGQIVPGTGVMLNNMLGEEDLLPEGLNSWMTDQRMTSMMSPTMARFPDGRTVATGSGGSKRIRTAILHVLVNLIDHGMGVEEAVSSPRLFLEGDLLSVEGGFDEQHVERLVEDYPRHEIWDELNLFFGGAHTVERRPDGFCGAGDPRRGGVAIVVR